MSTNSIYEVPKALQDYILQERGNPVSGSAQRRNALNLLRNQWQALVDRMTFAQMNDLIGIKRNPTTGRLEPTWSADHTYSDGVLLALPYRFITKELIEKYLGEYLGWLEVDARPVPYSTALVQVTLRPREGTSNLRVRAFGEAVARAKTSLAGIVSNYSTATGDSPMLVIEQATGTTPTGTRSGVMVYQVYWLLLVAKEVRDNLTDLMRAALKVTRTEAEAKVIKRDTGASFATFAERHRKALKNTNVGRPSIQNLPLPTPGALTPRTWGIEVEAAGAKGVAGPGGDWERKGDGSLSSAYYDDSRRPENCPDHDHDTFRGSCGWLNNDRYEDGDYGDTAEFVSPPMGTAHSAELKELVEALAREPQNDTAGVHVHVDASDLTPRNIGGLVFAYQMIEPIIEDYYQRETRNYCRVRTHESVLNTVRSSKKPGVVKHYKEQSKKPGSEILNYGDRYVAVNLQALEAHGTVEFRAMGPVYDYEHLIKWALFVREMVSIAKLNLPAKVWTGVKTWRDLEKIIAKYGTEVPEFIIERLEKNLAAAPVGERELANA